MDGRMPVSTACPSSGTTRRTCASSPSPTSRPCAPRLGIEVRERLVLDDAGKPVTEEHNFLGSFALYRLG
jgi:hypothetical protein